MTRVIKLLFVYTFYFMLSQKFRNHFKWTFHNLVAHPLSEIVWLFGFKSLSGWIHDASIPSDHEEEGRG